MKAERRHELQRNSLARFLENLPLYFRFHFGKIVLGALILVLVVMLVRYRVSAGRVERQRTTTALANLRHQLDELQIVDITRDTPQRRADDRRRLANEINAAVDEVLQQTGDGPEDAAVRAEALAIRGDMSWTMANLPAIPGSTTQPLLVMEKTSEQYLADAEDAYQRVLREYPDQKLASYTAMFGLASIAENRGQWDAAKAQYEALIAKPDAPQVYKDWARARIETIPIIKEPVFAGTLTSRPTTQPESGASPASATQPATQPATAPFTP